MRKNGTRMQIRRLMTLLLAMMVTVSSMSLGAFAGNTEPTQRYQINEDGSQTLLPMEPIPGGRLDLEALMSACNEEFESEEEEMPAAEPLYSKVFQVYSTYFDYNPMNMWSAFSFSNYTGFYLDYKPSGAAKWVRCYNRYGYALSAYSNYSFGGLKPNTNYQIRLVDEDDGRKFWSTTFHSGMASKPSVKSVKVKAIKLKRHRRRNRTPYLGLPLRGYHYVYSYKIKVTVKLKKKPGTKGIFINGEWVKGNKKKYSITFPRKGKYSNLKSPRRKKFTVYAYSGFSKDYGGYSPLYKKTKRVS